MLYRKFSYLMGCWNLLSKISSTRKFQDSVRTSSGLRTGRKDQGCVCKRYLVNFLAVYLTEQNLGRVMCRIIKKNQDKSQFFDNKSGDFLILKQSIQLGRKKMLCKETKVVLKIRLIFKVWLMFTHILFFSCQNIYCLYNISIFWLASIFSFRVSLSEAHARLNLRNKVLKEDVLIAALLFETSLTLKYGNLLSY